MTRDDWLSQFSDELIKLRPHLSERFARTLALSAYSTEHPRVAARQYHAQQQPSPGPAVAKRAKR